MAKKTILKCAVNPKAAELSQTLKVISDPNRLRILCTLFSGEKCVCEIEEGLAISQPLASHHLGVLREAGLVEVRKEGISSFCSLKTAAILRLNREFLEILGEHKPAERDPARVFSAGRERE